MALSGLYHNGHIDLDLLRGPSAVLAPPSLDAPQNNFPARPLRLFFNHRQHNKHYLTAALPPPMARAVFALRADETRPMAGHPIWINSF